MKFTIWSGNTVVSTEWDPRTSTTNTINWDLCARCSVHPVRYLIELLKSLKCQCYFYPQLKIWELTFRTIDYHVPGFMVSKVSQGSSLKTEYMENSHPLAFWSETAMGKAFTIKERTIWWLPVRDFPQLTLLLGLWLPPLPMCCFEVTKADK